MPDVLAGLHVCLFVCLHLHYKPHLLQRCEALVKLDCAGYCLNPFIMQQVGCETKIHTRTHTHAHTHTHTHTHTYALRYAHIYTVNIGQTITQSSSTVISWVIQ